MRIPVQSVKVPLTFGNENGCQCEEENSFNEIKKSSAKDQLMELLDKTTSSNDSYDDDNNDGDRRHMWRKGKRILPEMKVRYGAHLNRFTFLKNEMITLLT